MVVHFYVRCLQFLPLVLWTKNSSGYLFTQTCWHIGSPPHDLLSILWVHVQTYANLNRLLESSKRVKSHQVQSLHWIIEEFSVFLSEDLWSFGLLVPVASRDCLIGEGSEERRGESRQAEDSGDYHINIINQVLMSYPMRNMFILQ